VEVYGTNKLPINMRKDLTLSLEEEHINELLEIAEKQNTTLSALIRTIVSSYLATVRQGTAPVFPETLTIPEDGGEISGVMLLSQTVTKQGGLIAELQRRVTILEGTIHKSAAVQTVLGTSVSDIMSLTSPVLMSADAGVIDTDLPSVAGLSDDALVKVQRRPVAPVMDAMEMGSMTIRVDKEYSQTEASVALGISVSTMRKYIKEKKIPARKVGRSWLIHGKDILSFRSNA